MESIREQILQGIAALFTPTAIRSPTVQDFAEATDLIIGITDAEQISEPQFGSWRNSMTIRVEAIYKMLEEQVADRSSVANGLLADLISTIGEANTGSVLPPLIERLDPTDSGVLYPPESSAMIGAYAEFSVVYWTTAFNPHTKPEV